MNKKAVITVKSNISVEEDSIEVITPGVFTVLKNGFKAEYEETKLSGMEGTKTTMMINKNSFELIRCGSTETQMIFDRNNKSMSLYKTPYGNMTITIDTKQMKIDVDENGGNIHIVYTLQIEGQQKIETDLNVNIKVK
ncbi:MAG: DUF1934 domain-containing protein [Clostridium butyricum]|nr:DUF1934 domain-containing protein [Clostridium butyricum]